MNHGSLAATRANVLSIKHDTLPRRSNARKKDIILSFKSSDDSPASRPKLTTFLILLFAAFFAVIAPVSSAPKQPQDNPDHGFSYNPNDTRGQGNMGQPDMRDPYGFDKDRSRLETGNQGRVIKPPKDKEDPEPEPDNTFPPRPAVNLSAPISTSISWAWRFNYSNGQVSNFTDKLIQWEWSPKQDLAGFLIYEKAPADLTFRRIAEVSLSLGSGWHLLSTDPATSEEIQAFLGSVATTNLSTATLVIKRPSSQWSAGSYEHYIIPINFRGQPGYSSSKLVCTALGEIAIIFPPEGTNVPYQPAFKWADITQGVLTETSTGFYEVTVWGGKLLSQQPLWRILLPLSATGVVYNGPKLYKDYEYSVIVTVTIQDAGSPYGNSIGQSKVVHFIR